MVMTDAAIAAATTISLKHFSYRFAEQVLNSNLSLKNEVESVLLDKPFEVAKLGREHFNCILKESVRAGAKIDRVTPREWRDAAE